jgi:hypothetical protein
MRAAFTCLVALFFIAVTCVLSLIDGAVRTAADPDAVVAVVNRAGVRPALIAAAEELAYANLGQNGAEDPGLGAISRVQIRGVIDDVLAETWFEAALRRCHQALVLAVAAAQGSSVLDLRPFKSALQNAIGELGGRAEKACIDLAGQAECADDHPARRALETQIRHALAAVAHLDDKVDLAVLLTHDGVTDASFRRWLERAPQLRSVGLVVVAVLFGMILAINMSPLRRLLAVAGVVLLLAAAAGIGSHRAAADRAQVELERRIPEAPVFRQGDPTVARLLLPAVTRLASAFLDGAAAAARPPLLLGGVAGLVLVAAALATRGRRA